MSKPQIEPVEITRDATGWSESLERRAEPRTATPLSRSPLSHPLFLFALALLLLNDHVLKHVDLLPNALTGKLSDFAGLIVAPIVLSILLRAKGTAARACCFALVAIVFSAVNLSPDAARAFERATALIGMPWSVFVDPTDLAGFLSYPFAWVIAKSDGPSDKRILAVAALACAASSPAVGSGWSTSAFAINRTERPLALRLRWATAAIDCDAVRGRSAEIFGPDIFGEPVSFMVEPNHVLPLNELLAIPPEQIVETRACEAVLIKADGLPDTLLFFDTDGRTDVPAVVEETDEDRLSFDVSRMVVIEDRDGALRISAGDGLESGELIESVPDPECVDDAPRFGWSTFPQTMIAELAGVEAGADGCLALDFRLTDRFYLCAIDGAFPFAAGDLLSITARDDANGRFLSMVLDGEQETTELMLWSGLLEHAPLRVNAADRDECGRRLPCGSYAVPAELLLVEQKDEVTMMVGSAERLLAGAAGCEAGRDVAGYVADVLFVKREVKQ
jgi:hypothetical protein